jgi:uncharacterized protein YjbI with pentapeptide repeats
MAFLLGAGILAGLVLWWVPKWQVSRSRGDSRFTNEHEARKVLAEILGGGLLLAGVWASIENLKISQQTLVTSQQGQRTEVMAKAVDRLNHDNEFTRMGAVMILGQLAEQSANDRGQVLKLLEAYLRARSPSDLQSFTHALGLEKPSSVDIAAAVQVLVRPIIRINESHPLILSHISFHDVDLHGARLDGAKMWGTHMGKVGLTGASLVGADVRNSVVWMLYGENTNAASSTFIATKISAEVNKFNLTRAKFLGCTIEMTSLKNANLQEAVFATSRLISVDLSHANLRSANFAATVPFEIDPSTGLRMKAEPNLKTKTELGGVNFTGADLSGCDLRGVDLTKTSGLTREQVSVAIQDAQTILPQHLR